MISPEVFIDLGEFLNGFTELRSRADKLGPQSECLVKQ